MPPINLGLNNITKLYKGSTEIDKVYLGTNEIYTRVPPVTPVRNLANIFRNPLKDISLGTGDWNGITKLYGQAGMSADGLYALNNSTNQLAYYDSSNSRISSFDFQLPVANWTTISSSADFDFSFNPFVILEESVLILYVKGNRVTVSKINFTGGRRSIIPSGLDFDLPVGDYFSSRDSGDRGIFSFLNNTTNIEYSYQYSLRSNSITRFPGGDRILGVGNWRATVAGSDHYYYVDSDTNRAVAYNLRVNLRDPDYDWSLGPGNFKDGYYFEKTFRFIEKSGNTSTLRAWDEP